MKVNEKSQQRILFNLPKFIQIYWQKCEYIMIFTVNILFKEKHGSSGEGSLKKAGRPRLENSPLREYWRKAKHKQKAKQ